jgi:hypothetical protein
MKTENLSANPYELPALALDQGPEWRSARQRSYAEHAARLAAAASPPPQEAEGNSDVCCSRKDAQTDLTADVARPAGACSVEAACVDPAAATVERRGGRRHYTEVT